MASELSRFIDVYILLTSVPAIAVVICMYGSMNIHKGCMNELKQMHAEDELKAQGIHDDEEQKLLSDLRLKPLSVDQNIPTSPWSSRRKYILLLVGVIIVVAAAIVVGGSYYKRGLTTRDISSSPKPNGVVPPLDTKGKDDVDYSGDGKVKHQDDYADDDYKEEDEDYKGDYKEEKNARKKEGDDDEDDDYEDDDYKEDKDAKKKDDDKDDDDDYEQEEEKDTKQKKKDDDK
eukprot:jgi/Picsp_1/6219/NSC_03573-R1_---NA---